ncbi:MAG: hypothetical protein LBE12_03030 [Planctomycetaceae bacterium]|nr:hypothetical protein [Planctomycetaceae bacterium]
MMNILSYNVTELCCWDIPFSEIVDRSAQPWDNTDRRPSHRDKRKYMKLQFLQKELKAFLQSEQNPQKIFEKLKAFMMAA